MSVFVTLHAIERYRERVANCSDAEAIVAMNSDTITTAAAFGAAYVRLPGRQRVVLDGRTVVTVLPAETPTGYVPRWGKW